ncbi:MAG: biopolymer transporter ExbD [Planctomycetota bacterium]
MGKRADAAQSDKAELDMTSMIDVVFLLLIFFMCATKFKIPEGALSSFLPRDRGNSQASPEITRGCRVTLTMEGPQIHIWGDERKIANNPGYNEEYEDFMGIEGPDMEALEQHILFRQETYVGGGDKGLPVIIDAGDTVPGKYVVAVINICKRISVQDVSIAQKEIPIE